MNFDTFYNKILESLNGSNLVALDGGREVYICNVYIEEYYNTKELDSIKIMPIRRMSEDILMYWDKDTGEQWDMFIRKYTTLEQAIDGLATDYLLKQNIENDGIYNVDDQFYFELQAAEFIKDKLRELFKPYTHLPGEWGYSAFSDHDILEFGIEIDIETYRMGGIRDSVKTTIDSDEDISDW